MPWFYVGIVLVAALIVGVMLLLSVTGFSGAFTRVVILGSFAAAIWTFVTIGSDVRVPGEGAADSAVCVVNALGENPTRVVPWDTECGQAFADHLIRSIAPTGVMLLAVLGLLFAAVVRRDEPRIIEVS